VKCGTSSINIGGNLGSDGCVAFQFERKGTLVIERNDARSMMIKSLWMRLKQVPKMSISILKMSLRLRRLRPILPPYATRWHKNTNLLAQDLGPVPLTWVELEDEETISNMTKLIDLLEDNDDVQDVYHNWAQEDDA
jgi:transcriptional/translational regulatory protein YebC/TACO1